MLVRGTPREMVQHHGWLFPGSSLHGRHNEREGFGELPRPSMRPQWSQHSWWRHQMETFPRNWPFVRAIHRSPVNSPHKGQWRGALMCSLICARINGWINNGEAGDLRRYSHHYEVIIMWHQFLYPTQLRFHKNNDDNNNNSRSPFNFSLMIMICPSWASTMAGNRRETMTTNHHECLYDDCIAARMSVNAWRCVSDNCKLDLVDIYGGLTGEKYIDEIIRRHVEPHIDSHTLTDRYIFMWGVARPHTARISQELLTKVTSLLVVS